MLWDNTTKKILTFFLFSRNKCKLHQKVRNGQSLPHGCQNFWNIFFKIFLRTIDATFPHIWDHIFILVPFHQLCAKCYTKMLSIINTVTSYISLFNHSKTRDLKFWASFHVSRVTWTCHVSYVIFFLQSGELSGNTLFWRWILKYDNT